MPSGRDTVISACKNGSLFVVLKSSLWIDVMNILGTCLWHGRAHHSERIALTMVHIYEKWMNTKKQKQVDIFGRRGDSHSYCHTG